MGSPPRPREPLGPAPPTADMTTEPGPERRAFETEWRRRYAEIVQDLAQQDQDAQGREDRRDVLRAAAALPLRDPARTYDLKPLAAIRDLLGDEPTGRFLKLLMDLPGAPADAARFLDATAAADPGVATSLDTLVEHLDPGRLQSESLLKREAGGDGGRSVQLENIQAGVLNVGGTTHIENLRIDWGSDSPGVPVSRLRRWGGYVAGLISLLASVIAFYEFGWTHWRGPPRMTGDFNVALTVFGAAQGAPKNAAAAAADLADSVYQSMQRALEVGAATADGSSERLQIPVLSPANLGKVAGENSAERAQSAKTLANRINADLVIYGVLQFGETVTRFLPEFYLSERKFKQASELPGQYDFGSPIEVSGDIEANTAARTELRGRLISRASALAYFALGLGHYVRGELEQADHFFLEAAAAKGWDDRDGKEVLFLFLGNSAGMQAKWDLADDYFARSVQLRPDYARAWLGIAEIRFQRAKGDCQPGLADHAGLTEVLAGFRKAARARLKPSLAFVDEKAAFGEGRVFLCLSSAMAGDYSAQGEERFRA